MFLSQKLLGFTFMSITNQALNYGENCFINICEESDFTLDPSLKECSFSFRKCKRKLRWLSFFITVEFSTSFPSFYTCSTLTYFSLYQSQNTHPNQDPFTLPTCGSCFRIQQMPDQSKEQLSQLSSFFMEWKFVFTISKVQ